MNVLWGSLAFTLCAAALATPVPLADEWGFYNPEAISTIEKQPASGFKVTIALRHLGPNRVRNNLMKFRIDEEVSPGATFDLNHLARWQATNDDTSSPVSHLSSPLSPF